MSTPREREEHMLNVLAAVLIGCGFGYAWGTEGFLTAALVVAAALAFTTAMVVLRYGIRWLAVRGDR